MEDPGVDLRIEKGFFSPFLTSVLFLSDMTCTMDILLASKL